MIVTFYSYKGGVGRSMALVNVGEHLARRGVPVVLVDWDLEAPGLERYFPVQREDVEERPGVLDLLLEYRQAMARPGPPAPEEPEQGTRETRERTAGESSHVGQKLGFGSPRERLLDLGPSVGLPPGRLRLLPAGRRGREQFATYAANVQAFDWAGFYRDWEGEAYLEWFRRELTADGALVLVDSRTGVTEIGGVCVYQLADVVVMLCAANQSNLEGTSRMAEAFDRPVVKELRGERKLKILPVPARIPKVEQIQEINSFLNEFADRMGGYYRRLGLDPEDAARRFWIPQIPLYSFKERVAVRETGRSLYRNDDLTAVYGEIAATLEKLAPPKSPLARISGSASLLPTLPEECERFRQEKARRVLRELDQLVGQITWLCRRRRRRQLAAKLLAAASPFAAAAVLLPFAAQAAGGVVALLPVLLALLMDVWPGFERSSIPWREVERLSGRLAVERIAFEARQGPYRERLDPARTLSESVTAARQQVGAWGISLERETG